MRERERETNKEKKSLHDEGMEKNQKYKERKG